MKLSFFSAFVAAFFLLPTALAESETSQEEGYRTPVYEGIKFEAELIDDGVVYMSWNAFEKRNNEEFLYYKVMRSYGNSNPVYPEENAMAVKLGVGDTRHTDKDAYKSAYYRVCVITNVKGRYCSNVVWIEKGEDNRQELHNKLSAENHNRKEKHEEAWKAQKAEKEASQKPMKENSDKASFRKPLEKIKDKRQLLTEKKSTDKDSTAKRMPPEKDEANADMEERMEKAFEKVKPKLDKFLGRVETALVDSEELNNEQKVEKIKKLQQRFYGWKKDNLFKTKIVKYLDEFFNEWIEALSNEFEVDDIDAMLDGLFDQ